MLLLRYEPEVTITEGALRWVSEVRERYVTQRGLVGTWMGLGFNICVADVLSLYFRGRDELRFGEGEGE